MADRIKNYQQEADQITTLKEIRTDLGVTPSSYTPDATVVTKDRVVTFAQAEEELVVLSDIEKGVKQQVTEVDIAQKDIANIKALLQGHLYDYQTDSTSAYTKSVPSGAMPYAGLEKVGGKTVVWNQLVDSGTTTVSTISGHMYYTLIDGTASIVTSDGSAISVVDDTADMVCDLTLMFGSGNEPSTVEEFESVFPASYYAYNAGTLLSAGVTSVVSKDGNNATLQTYSIPTAIRNIEGYGWSAGSVYNYIDFERKVFVQNVARVDLGSLGWTYNTGGTRFYTYGSNTENMKAPTTTTVVANIICSLYETKSYEDTTSGGNDMTMGLYSDLSNTYLAVRNFSYTDVTTFKNAMNGVYAYYELETPVETDISQYLTDDNLIQVESGGALTFPNSNGTDYQIPVPSEETYMIDLQSAI